MAYRSVWTFVHDEKLSFKKNVVAGERERPDVARRRAQWIKDQDRIDPSRLVFIDHQPVANLVKCQTTREMADTKSIERGAVRRSKASAPVARARS